MAVRPGSPLPPQNRPHRSLWSPNAQERSYAPGAPRHSEIGRLWPTPNGYAISCRPTAPRGPAGVSAWARLTKGSVERSSMEWSDEGRRSWLPCCKRACISPPPAARPSRPTSLASSWTPRCSRKRSPSTTDAKLLQRARERLVKLAQKQGVKLRQSYVRVGKSALIRHQRYAREAIQARQPGIEDVAQLSRPGHPRHRPQDR